MHATHTSRFGAVHRALTALLALILAGFGTACAAPNAERIADTLDPADFGARSLLVVHYHRPAEDYAGWNLWTWGDGADGGPVAFDGATSFGRYAVVPVQPGTTRQGFIIRLRDWAGKDVDRDRFVDLDADGVTEIWLVSGDTRVFQDPSDIDLSVRLVGAFLDAGDAIHATTSAKLTDEQLAGAVVMRGEKPAPYTITEAGMASGDQARGVLYRLTLDQPVAFEHISDLTLQVPDLDPVTVFARDVLNEDRFNALDAELGSRHTDSATTFRIWSPVSESVDLLLYNGVDDAQPARTISMSHTGRGVWETEVAGDLHGTAYQYRYHSYGQDRIAPDIHCFAATSDSSRSVVLDFARIEPEGWASVPQPTLASSTDEIIYEIHVRDVSIDDPSLDESLRGTCWDSARPHVRAGFQTRVSQSPTRC